MTPPYFSFTLGIQGQNADGRGYPRMNTDEDNGTFSPSVVICASSASISGSSPYAMTVLTPELLVRAYCSGVFPMADSRNGRISWYAPDPRAIFPLDGFHIPRSLARTIRRGAYEVRVDTAFDEVMMGCAAREETWISTEVFSAYTTLHRLGLAHSVEAWYEGKLAGGLYGVALGGAFFGESMFSHRTDASKVALVALVERLRARGYTLLDTQWVTDHLARFGAIEIPRAEYERRLAAALQLDCRFADEG
jgi:leucyl/phenylalanyl-tRNA---protein transferase